MSDNIDKVVRLAELTAELEHSAATEPIGVRRLREAREGASARNTSAMTDTTGATVVRAGDVIHAVSTGMTLPRTVSLWGGLPPLTLTRGDRIVVTTEMISAAVDRNGDPGWVALVHDAERQVRRWGRVHLAPGEPPADLQPWEYGTPDWAEAREEARKAAWKEVDPQRRAAALQRVHAVYGPPPVTSTITSTYKIDRAYEEQQARIAASAAAGTPNIGSSQGA